MNPKFYWLLAGSGTVAFFVIVGLAIYSLHPHLVQPKVHLEFSGLNDTYNAGQRINFNVSVTGDACDYPQYVMIQSLQNGRTVWLFNGTGLNAAISCPHIGGGGKMTYDTAQGVWKLHWIDLPIVINQTGMYRVIAGFYDEDKIQRDFSIVLASSPSSGYILSFEGLKDHYLIGEKMDFVLKINGYGSSCGTPNIDIIDNSGSTLYTLYKHGTFSCIPNSSLLNQTWSMKDFDAENFTLPQAGDYKLVGSYHDTEVTKTIKVS